MRLIVSEKNIAARRIAEILAVGKPKADKVYQTPVYRFRRDGEDWVSIGLKGHIMKVDFPEEHGGVGLGTPWDLDQLSTMVKAPVNKYDAEKGIIRSLTNLAKKAESVVIATDYDREGELIGSDARGIVLAANPGLAVSRARFSAITKEEIERAFSESGVLSDDLAEAGATRQDIDLIWGAVMTRYLTLASNKASKRRWGDLLSAGRVQTPTLKLIVDKEKERDAFVPEDYWQIKAGFAKDSVEFSAGHGTDRFKDEATAQAAMAALEGATTGTVTDAAKAKRQSKPPAPFNTTSLQAAAASEGLTPARTMRIAENLYMDGYISYPRVDNTVYPASLDFKGILKSLSDVPFYAEHANGLLRRGEIKPTRGKKETTDHPPIHPTAAADPDRLKPEQWKLYNLIARRFMATLSDAALIEGTKVVLDVNGQPFVAKGDVIVSPGYRAIYPYGLKKEEHLPALAEGDVVEFTGAELAAKQTQPPARYTQGKLIQEMERLGLGTKATRHNIIQNLYDRRYVINDPAEPTNKGRSVVNALTAYAAEITTPEMTSQLEAEMDSITKAEASREEVVAHSRKVLGAVMDDLLERVPEVGEALKAAADEDAKLGACPESGHDLLIKYSPRNRTYFVGCSGYPDCTVTYPLPQAIHYESVDGLCPECGTPQVTFRAFRQQARTVCLNTQCPTRQEPEIALGACPTGDGGTLRVIRSQKSLKRFVRCTNYENCGTSYPLPQRGDIEPTDEVCEPCGAPKIIVTTKRGPWKICIDPDCPTKAGDDKGSKTAAGKRGGARGSSASKAGAKKTGTKKTGAKKTAAKKSAPKKSGGASDS